jgi:PqqD family protein of HPr-rel-A system
MGEEWVLYDPRTRKLHVLNLTAALVWGLLDGEVSREDVVRELRDTLREVPDDRVLEAEVARVLADFDARGLLA